jgi:hypothetical protein
MGARRAGPRIVAAATAVAGGLLAGLMLWRVDPASSALYPRCPFFLCTGLYCPGCGALRAFHRLLHGELGAAFRMNALAVVLLPLVALGLLQHALPRLLPRWAPERASPRSVWAIGALLVLFAVARNLPWEPFRWLAPH